jgi:hypothetical protein
MMLKENPSALIAFRFLRNARRRRRKSTELFIDASENSGPPGGSSAEPTPPRQLFGHPVIRKKLGWQRIFQTSEQLRQNQEFHSRQQPQNFPKTKTDLRLLPVLTVPALTPDSLRPQEAIDWPAS